MIRLNELLLKNSQRKPLAYCKEQLSINDAFFVQTDCMGKEVIESANPIFALKTLSSIHI